MCFVHLIVEQVNRTVFALAVGTYIKMRPFGFVIILALIGCGQTSREKAAGETVLPTHEEVAQQDTRQNDFKFPEWLSKLYPAEVKYEYHTFNQELIAFKTVNDSVNYCITRQMDGVCGIDYLVTYVYEHRKDSLEVGHNCDHELSTPTYSWKDFVIKSSNVILTTEYTESVHDTLIDANGRVKAEYDFLESKTTVDTIRRLFQVDQNGEIFEINE